MTHCTENNNNLTTIKLNIQFTSKHKLIHQHRPPVQDALGAVRFDLAGHGDDVKDEPRRTLHRADLGALEADVVLRA